MARRVAVVGAGWAGLAAAVQLVLAGSTVTLFEASPIAGGRARSFSYRGRTLDCGQHILLGAYASTLRLMRQVGVDIDQALQRHPLTLLNMRGEGLHLGKADSSWGALRFGLSVARQSQWTPTERWAFLKWAVCQQATGFRCPDELTVEHLLSELPRNIVDECLSPLCLAALNTPVARASAQVFLRVLRDALFSGPGSSDLLLPTLPLSAVLVDAAVAYLMSQGAQVHLGRRIEEIERDGDGWGLCGARFDAVILATSAPEAARLMRHLAPSWAELAAGLQFEAISTLYLEDSAATLHAQSWSCPMRALNDGPAQYVFNLEALQGEPAKGLWSLVASAPAPDWSADKETYVSMFLQQWRANWEVAGYRHHEMAPPPRVVAQFSERRATFACTTGLRRPGSAVMPGMSAAGDYLSGPYPSTLEGAVRAGMQAATHCLAFLAG